MNLSTFMTCYTNIIEVTEIALIDWRVRATLRPFVALPICGLKWSQATKSSQELLLCLLDKHPASWTFDSPASRWEGWVFDLSWSVFWLGNIWQTDAAIYKRKPVLNIDQLQEIIPIDIWAYRQPSIVGGVVATSTATPQENVKWALGPKPFIFFPSKFQCELLFTSRHTEQNERFPWKQIEFYEPKKGA